MYRKYRSLFLLGGVALGLVLVSGCVAYDGQYAVRGGITVSGPVARPLPPGHFYRYHYYPELEVYYYPRSRMYFWFQGDNWVSGLRLPGRFSLAVNNWLWLELDSNRPYRYHDRTKSKHPRSYKPSKRPPARPRITTKAPRRPKPPTRKSSKPPTRRNSKKGGSSVTAPPGSVPVPPGNLPVPPVPGAVRKPKR
jgi:hypothetical protein